ncbi:hypothetical protein FJ987_12380 [Mesorhizobium sp. CU2]|nr:hypothetical protein FJ987_12380 [Mesorhizobium sp. CU2]
MARLPRSLIPKHNSFLSMMPKSVKRFSDDIMLLAFDSESPWPNGLPMLACLARTERGSDF